MQTRTLPLILSFLAASDALKTRWAPCCFSLSSSGAATGLMGQLDDGQNRINGPLSPAEYCIADGAITDAHGRGCILTPGVTQFQCDQGSAPLPGFSVGCDGTLAYDGDTSFSECQTGMDLCGEANVYLHPGGTNCGAITLKASSCFSGCPTPAPPAPPAPSCPVTLNGGPYDGAYEFPHLIIPLDSSKPDTALGTSYFGEISSTVSTIFNFDIPAADQGKTCSLIFLFPNQADLTTSSFTGNGGDIDFSMLNGPADENTTFATAPGIFFDYGVKNLSPGNSYSIGTFPCPAGQRIAFEMKSAGQCGLHYFQDWNPSPLGLYITKC